MTGFTVIVPAFNCQEWIDRCLDSILSQTYPKFRAIVVNDGSTDMTPMALHKYADRCLVYHHRPNSGSTIHSHILAMRAIEIHPWEVIVDVDGDDYLPDRDVLSHLAEIYRDPQVWMTYGSYREEGSLVSCGAPVTNPRGYRQSRKWHASHLRTYRRWLWDRIRDEDLRGNDGAYYRAGGDAAFMYPMIEMAGVEHARFISRVMYVYNNRSPLHDWKIHPQEQAENGARIRERPTYLPFSNCHGMEHHHD